MARAALARPVRDQAKTGHAEAGGRGRGRAKTARVREGDRGRRFAADDRVRRSRLAKTGPCAATTAKDGSADDGNKRGLVHVEECMSDEKPARVRTREPMRRQAVIRFEMPEDTLPADHRARVLWRVVEALDLSAFTARARAVEGRQGRDLLSVHMLLTLWLYAISVGIGSAREIARRIGSDDAFRWIVGDQRVGHVTLSTFRVGHREALDALFTDVLASLMHKGLVSLDLVAQDGTRVRASASPPSFRREASLMACREQAALHVKAVFAEADDPSVSEREKRAREAAALEFQRRVEAAIDTVRELQSQGKDEPRASTTDADARVMKMADGGFRPGYNIQMATAGSAMGGPRTIVGIRVTNVGSDMGSVTPMLDEIERRTGALPAVLLADANHAKHDCIRSAAERGVRLLVPVPERRDARGDKAADDPAVCAWREDMQTEEAKSLYRARASLCELPNAHMKCHHGLAQVLVRGLEKAGCVALLAGLTANLLAHARALLG
jgi:transposase